MTSNSRRSIAIEPVVNRVARERVAVPDMRSVDAVQDQVCQTDGINEVFFFTTEQGARAERLDLLHRGVGLEIGERTCSNASARKPPVPQPGS